MAPRLVVGVPKSSSLIALVLRQPPAKVLSGRRVNFTDFDSRSAKHWTQFGLSIALDGFGAFPADARHNQRRRNQ